MAVVGAGCNIVGELVEFTKDGCAAEYVTAQDELADEDEEAAEKDFQDTFHGVTEGMRSTG